MAEALPELREAFDMLFIAPFASHRWASRRGRSHWVDLEGWQDTMAGPLTGIAETGGCGYAYARDDQYFAAISDPAGMRARLLEWHAGLATGVGRFVPVDSDEADDLEFMRTLVGRMRELIERACVIEQARYRTAGDV
jgi:hypothetical protein